MITRRDFLKVSGVAAAAAALTACGGSSSTASSAASGTASSAAASAAGDATAAANDPKVTLVYAEVNPLDTIVGQTATHFKEKVEELWKDMAVFKTDTVLRPDYFVCVGPRVCDYSAVDLDQVMLLMDLDIMDREPDEDIIVVASVNDVR